MSWDASREDSAIRSYRLHHVLSGGDVAERQIADRDHLWAWEAVAEAAMDGSLPLSVVDGLLHDPEADDWYRECIAAGPIEDLLSYHAARHAKSIAERCEADPVWAWTMGGVWIDREQWLTLPASLRKLVPEPIEQVEGHKRSKRPSKRQGKRPRHP